MGTQSFVQDSPLTAHSFVACVKTVAMETNILKSAFSLKFVKLLGLISAAKADLLKREQAIECATARGVLSEIVRYAKLMKTYDPSKMQTTGRREQVSV